MHKITLLILGAVFAVALAGQFYVPRAYYTIDPAGHESVRVPLRRLRRSLNPYPYAADANANAHAEANGGDANANANAYANAGAQGSGGWNLPLSGDYGASNPNLLSSGMARRTAGFLQGRSVSASTSVGVDSAGQGFYEQSTSVE